MEFSRENVFQVWNDSTGEVIEIGADGDGLDMVEIRQRSSDSKIVDRITMPREQAEILHKALGDYIAFLPPKA